MPTAGRRPLLALGSSFVASFDGALLATVLLTLFARAFALGAIEFGPAELFAVFILSFTALVGLCSQAPLESGT